MIEILIGEKTYHILDFVDLPLVLRENKKVALAAIEGGCDRVLSRTSAEICEDREVAIAAVTARVGTGSSVLGVAGRFRDRARSSW